jgi:phage tail like protein
MIENMKEADKVREVAENSTGSAWREQEKWAKSLQGHLGSLSASWEKLASQSLNGNFVKGFINATKGVLDLTNALGGLVPVLLSIIAISFSTKIIAIGDALIGLATRVPVLSSVLNTLIQTLFNLKLSASAVSGIITGGFAFAVVGAIALFNHFHQSAEELQQQLNKTSEEYNTHKDNITKYSSELETAKARLDELNKLKEQGNITQKQNDELNLLVKQNNELQRKLDLEKTLVDIKAKAQDSQALAVLNKKSEYAKDSVADVGSTQGIGSYLTKTEYMDYLLNKQDSLKKWIREKEDSVLKGNAFAERDLEKYKKELDNLKNETANYITDISDIVSKLSEGSVKDNYIKMLEDWSNKLSDVSDKAKETKENFVNLGGVSTRFSDIDSVKKEQEDLQKYYDEYNKSGVLSTQTVNDMLAKYPQYIDFLIKTADGYKLNTEALDRLNNIKQTQKDITDKYIDSLNKEKDALSSRDFAKESNTSLTSIQDEYNKRLTPIRTEISDTSTFGGKIGRAIEADNSINTQYIDGLNTLVDSITEINNKFAEGKTSVVDYFNQIKTSIDSVDLNKFKDSDFGQGVLQSLRDNIQQGMQYASSELQKGKISAIEYTKSIEKANQSVLDLYVAQQGLSQDTQGRWVNQNNLIDDYANQLANAQKELLSFNDYMSLLTANSEYLIQHLNALGDVAFTTADTMTTAYQNFADSMDSMLDKLSTSNKTAFDDVVSYMAEQNNITRESLVDSQGQFNRSAFDNAQVLNSAIKGSTDSLSRSVTNTITAIGKLLGSFKYELKFTPKLKIGSLVKAIESKNPADFISGAIEISGKGGYDSGSVFSAETEKALGDSISSTWKTADLLGYKPKGSSKPAPRDTKSKGSKGKGGGKGKSENPVELKDIQQVDEYTKAIEKLNLKLEILHNDRDFIVDTSKEYVQSLNTEIGFIKEKANLTDKEIEKTKKSLEKYKDLEKEKAKVEKLSKDAKSNDDKKKANVEIEKYNKHLTARENLEKKLQSLNKTNVDLQKQEIQIRQKKYELIQKETNEEISKAEKQISLLQAKQKFFKEGTIDYDNFTSSIDKEYDKIESLIKEKQIELKAILSSPYLSGDAKKSLQNELVENETKYQNTRLARFENSKQKRLKDIEKSVETIIKVLDPLEHRLELLSTKLSLVSNEDFKNRIDYLGEAFNLTKQHISGLEQSYERLNAIQPQTKEEAEKVANEMKNVASKIMQAKKSLWEYHKQIDIAKVDELSANYKKQFNELNGLISEFKHNLDMLNGGLLDGTDINFGVATLPDIPQSVYDKEKAELDALFTEQEAYEKRIRELKEKSYDEQLGQFKELNAEIQKDANGHYKELIDKLIKTLDKEEFVQDSKHKNIYSAIVKSLTDVEGAYTETWDSIVEKVIKAISQIENATKKGLYAYANFSKEGQFLGVTTGKSGTSNHLSNADYVVAENGKRYNITKKKTVPKYAKGTKSTNQQDNKQGYHSGGVALVGEEGEELAILPSGKSVIVGKYGSELVDLPKGTTIVPHKETMELQGYLGDDLDVKTIPAYAKGIGGALKSIVDKVTKTITDSVSRARDNIVRSERDTPLKEFIKRFEAKQGDYNLATGKYDDYSGYRYDSDGKLWYNQGIRNSRSTLNPYHDRATINRQKELFYSQKRTEQEKQEFERRFREYDRIIDKAIDEQNRKDRTVGRDIDDYSSAYGRYSSTGKNYYNQDNKTEHDRNIDRIRYDVYLTRDMANAFNQYKSNRDTVMNFIKNEQEAIKAHFASGGLRDTINDRIESLKNKIDEQTAKDVEMQYKMTNDILQQQKKLAENYLNQTRQQYLNGINNGMHSEALRKLKDEYADANKQFNDIEKSIKDNITARYEYEFSLIDKKLKKYNEAQDEINSKMRILNSATDSKDYRQQMTLNEDMVKSYKEQLKTLVGEYDKLVNQQGKFGVGSYEWNLFEEKIKSVNKQIGSVNENIASTIANNKKLANQRLEYVFETQNKAVEKGLLGDKTKEKLSREISKEKSYNQKYLEGLEKEHALDLIKRDLRREEISDFDTILSQMESKAKITRDEYETLQKQINVRKLEKELDKALGNLTEKSYVKKSDGTWDWQYQEDKDLVNSLQDKLTQAKIDLLKWQKELEIKKKENKLNDVNSFLSDLKELQQRALKGEFKNKEEFNEELKRLGLEQKGNTIWEDLQKSKMFDENGQFGNVMQLMSTSFQNYQTELIGLNTRLEELLKLLKIETNIRLNEWQNGVQTYGYKSYSNKATDDTLGNKDNIGFKNINDIKVLQAILEINKASIPNFDNVKNNLNQYLNNSSNVLTDANKKPNISEINNYFEKLVLPNVVDGKSFIEELKKLPIQAKQFVWGN